MGAMMTVTLKLRLPWWWPAWARFVTVALTTACRLGLPVSRAYTMAEWLLVRPVLARLVTT